MLEGSLKYLIFLLTSKLRFHSQESEDMTWPPESGDVARRRAVSTPRDTARDERQRREDGVVFRSSHGWGRGWRAAGFQRPQPPTAHIIQQLQNE
jgi:hypothetical protein